MSLIIRGGLFVNADQDFTADFFFEDCIIIYSLFCAPYYGAVEKRSVATAPFAVDR